MLMERVFIVGTGLIGASTGLALRAAGFAGRIDGWDSSLLEMAAALADGRDRWVGRRAARARWSWRGAANVIVLAVPVLAIKDWMRMLAPLLRAGQLVTDVGSTKLEIAELGEQLFSGDGDRRVFCRDIRWRARSRAVRCWREAKLFDGAMWLFTPTGPEMTCNREGVARSGWDVWVRGRWIWMRRGMMSCARG